MDFLSMDHETGGMDYEPAEESPFLEKSDLTLSPKALSTLRVMAFLDPENLHKDFFGPLRQVFVAKNAELLFGFPTTAAAYSEACAELVEASLIQLSEDEQAYSITPEIQTSVLADTQTSGLISPLFNVTVKVLTGLWPQMLCVANRTVDQREYAAAPAPGPDYEAYLRQRYMKGQLPQLQEYAQYARVNIWGLRDEFVCHVARLEHIFYHLDDEMIKVCATVTFAQLLAEVAWYYLERSRCLDAEAKIQAALGVYGFVERKSPLHHANIHRVHAAIAFERGSRDEAAQHVRLQLQRSEPYWTSQGEALKNSGLLDRAPDAVAVSPWGLDIPPGNFVVLPFRSVFSFGWKLYSSAQDEKDPKYAEYLDQAALCFSTVLKDRTSAHTKTAQTELRTGELLYALGNVATKQAVFHGKVYFDKSLVYFKNALQSFQAAAPDKYSAAGLAKTHYKIAVHFIRSPDLEGAFHHLDEAMQFYKSDTAYESHLARVIFQQSRIQAVFGYESANATLHKAFKVRDRVRPNESRFAEELSEADFDDLVGIWER